MEQTSPLEECGAFDPVEQSVQNAEAPVRPVISAVMVELRDGRKGIDGTAARLGISIRTLQRRLTRNGLNYRSLVEAVLKTRALMLLESTSLTVTEIAMELGYSEHANFTRAFRRWTGHSPHMYRERILPATRHRTRLSTSSVFTRSRAAS